jgi:glutamate/tyrosine decarboxylase-like PLP-dependent enzyme
VGDDEVLARAAERARSWLASLPERPVGVPIEADGLRTRLGAPLAHEGMDAGMVVDELVAALEPGLVAAPGPRYFGFVTGGSLPAALASDWLVSAFDQNPASYVMSPAVAVVEETAGRWLVDLLGLPAGCAVGFVTGGQMANFSGLAAARHALLAGQGWDVEADGLAGAPVPRVLVGEHAHYTVLQALRMLGFGSNRVIRVPADDQGRMRAAELAARLARTEGPVLVCAQAGEVNTGAIDPLGEIADVLAARGEAWLHVDGAFGLWAAASPELHPLLEGVERADSWRSTRTSGSTCPTTAGWRSSPTRPRCARRWRTPPRTSPWIPATRPAIPPRRPAAPGRCPSTRRCAAWGAAASPTW